VFDTDVLTRSYVGSRFEYDLRLGPNVVEVVTQDGTLAGDVRLVFGQDDAVLYPDVSVLSVEAQQLSTVSA
jgi:iron(III) transport system ATP-binding protein